MLPLLLLVAGGALLGGAATVLSAALRGQPITGQAVLAGVASGAVAGGVTGVGIMAGLTLGPLMALGAVTGLATSALSSWMTGQPITAKNLVTGAISGAVGLGAFKILASGGVANAVLGPVVGAVGGLAVAAVSHGWDWLASQLAPAKPAAETPAIPAPQAPAAIPTDKLPHAGEPSPLAPLKPVAVAPLAPIVHAPAPLAHPVLKRGARGPIVAHVQSSVGARPDGIFGPKTLAAVKKFQKAHDIPATGVVADMTWKELPPLTPTPAKAAPAKTTPAKPLPAPTVNAGRKVDPVTGAVADMPTPKAITVVAATTTAPPTPVAPTPALASKPTVAPKAARGPSFLKDALVDMTIGALLGVAAAVAPAALAPRSASEVVASADAVPAPSAPRIPVGQTPTTPVSNTPVSNAPAANPAVTPITAPVVVARPAPANDTAPAPAPVAGAVAPQAPAKGISQAITELEAGSESPDEVDLPPTRLITDGTKTAPVAPAPTKPATGALGDDEVAAATLKSPRLAKGERAAADEQLAAAKSARSPDGAPVSASEKDLWSLTMSRVGLRSNRAPIRLAQKDVMDASAEVNRSALAGDDVTLEKMSELNEILTRRAGSPGLRRTAVPGKPSPDQIQTELAAFLKWYGGARRPNTDPVELAAKSYQWLERIQPFETASSETNRQVLDLILERNGYPAARVGDLPTDATPAQAISQVALGVQTAAAR